MQNPWSPSLSKLQDYLNCFETSTTFVHKFKTTPTDEQAEFNIQVAVCLFPRAHDPLHKEQGNNNDSIQFDLFIFRSSVDKIFQLYYPDKQRRGPPPTHSECCYRCTQANKEESIHYRDLIRYLYDHHVSVQGMPPITEKADGSKPTEGVRELLETVALAESLTRVWRNLWQILRPGQYMNVQNGSKPLRKRARIDQNTTIRNQIANLESIILKSLPWKDLRTKLAPNIALQPHQEYGIQWMYLREQMKYFNLNGGILADEMGLGKTLQALALIVLQPHCCDADSTINLVVCKLSVLYQWSSEIQKFFCCDSIDVFIAHGSSDACLDQARQSACDSDRTTIVLSTYDKIRGWWQKGHEFIDWKFHRVICDEGHNIANANSETAKALSSLKARHRWILSGSPYRNSPRDLYSLAVPFLKLQDSFLVEERFGCKARWNRAFLRMDAIRDYETTGIVPKCNLNSHSMRDEARVECWLNVMLLRRTQEHANKIPDRINHDHSCRLGLSEEAAVYNHVQTAVETFVLEQLGESFTFTSVHGGVMLLRRICVSVDLLLKDEQDEEAMWKRHSGEGDQSIRHLTKHHLLQALPENLKSYLHGHKKNAEQPSSKYLLIKQCLENIVQDKITTKDTSPHKIVVFSQWSGALDLTTELIDTFFPGTFQILRIDGSTAGKERATQCESFNQDQQSSHMLLLNYKAAGEGLNLQKGQHVLLLDPWFTPSVEDQAVARVHRQGNTNKRVHVHRFIINNSIEQRVQAIGDNKREESKRLLSMGLVHRAKMAKNTIDFSKDAILDLISKDVDCDDP
jgi:SNF2 family DNA or RNA helicase